MIIHLKAFAIAVGVVCGGIAYLAAVVLFIRWLSLPKDLIDAALFAAIAVTVLTISIYRLMLDKLRVKALLKEDRR